MMRHDHASRRTFLGLIGIASSPTLGAAQTSPISKKVMPYHGPYLDQASPLFSEMSGISIPPQVELVQTSGYDQPGVGRATYAYTPASQHLPADRYSSFTAADGRLFTLSSAFATTDMFGCDTSGKVETSSSLKAFFDFCIHYRRRGYICAGTYLIDEGVLHFDCGFQDQPWPAIDTAGDGSVLIIGTGKSDAPLISLSNGDANSDVGRYWRGGRIGSMTFSSSGRSKGANSHGLSLRGVWGMEFGYIRGENLNGSTVFIPEFLRNKTNPDPYAVSFCKFEGIEAVENGGWALENRNWVGFNGNWIRTVRVIATRSGGVYGFGAANIVSVASMANHFGPSFDDGTGSAATGGAAIRFKCEQAELDNTEFGIMLNRCTLFEFGQIRINHRFSSGMNSGGIYWPKTALSLGAGNRTSLRMGSIRVAHRIEGGAGGSLQNLGILFDGHDSDGIVDVDIDQDIQDNANLGISDRDATTGHSANASYSVRIRGKLVSDHRVSASAIFVIPKGTVVGSSGYGSRVASLAALRQGPDPYGMRSQLPSPNFYVVPYSSMYRVSAAFDAILSRGSQIRYGIWCNRNSSSRCVASRTQYASSDGVESYSLDQIVYLLAGDQLFLSAVQNSQAHCEIQQSQTLGSENQWSIQAINS